MEAEEGGAALVPHLMALGGAEVQLALVLSALPTPQPRLMKRLGRAERKRRKIERNMKKQRRWMSISHAHTKQTGKTGKTLKALK